MYCMYHIYLISYHKCNATVTQEIPHCLSFAYFLVLFLVARERESKRTTDKKHCDILQIQMLTASFWNGVTQPFQEYF